MENKYITCNKSTEWGAEASNHGPANTGLTTSVWLLYVDVSRQPFGYGESERRNRIQVHFVIISYGRRQPLKQNNQPASAPSIPDGRA